MWNYDETNLRDNPGARKYVIKQGIKYPERITDSSKVTLSVMFCGNAEGEVVPPYVVYKSVHICSQWVTAGPPGTRYNRPKGRWFNETTFTEWFFTSMLPILCKQEGKKVLIGDNLSSNLHQSVIDACSKHSFCLYFSQWPSPSSTTWWCLVCNFEETMVGGVGRLEKISQRPKT